MPHEQFLFSIPPPLVRRPDPILGISKEYDADHRPFKIDAGIGVFRDENGTTFTPEAVLQAGKAISLAPVDYLSPSGEEEWLGDRTFLEKTARIVFGKHTGALLDEKRLAAVGTPGGTGAVALMADLLKTIDPHPSVLISEPTWPNHTQIFNARGIEPTSYPHASFSGGYYLLGAHQAYIKESSPNTVVVLHGGKTHNPTGVNPENAEQWHELAKSMQGRRAFFDIPYAGFGDGLEADTEGIRIFMEEGVAVGVAVSYAKNTGLYNQRPAALLIPALNKEHALQLQRTLNHAARVSYSSPPAFGERVVAHVLSSPSLFTQWQQELENAAQQLKTRRELLAQASGFDFITEQTGLFSVLPLSPEQVQELKEKYGIYMSSSGRVNIGGIQSKDIPRLGTAIQEVLDK